ncbi:MAG: SHOCT domain-containing protein [Spirochaetaceae bacterium]|nr:SHOCT domain-containing protein [Spirochaetaceae bacterium]
MHYLHGWPTQGFMGIGGPIIMIIFGIIFIGVLVYLAIAVSRKNNVQSGGSFNRDRGMDILKERFARGEITKDEYESMRITLLN